MGGQLNTALSAYSTIGGGRSNTASGKYSTVGGGQENTASLNYSAICGGKGNQVNPGPIAFGTYGFVGGGQGNVITSNGGFNNHDTIGGGKNNSITSGLGFVTLRSGYNTIGGGYNNTIAGGGATMCFIGGGQGNSTNSEYSSILGGAYNVDTSAGYGHVMIGNGNVIGGAGYNSTVIGNYNNNTGSFANIFGNNITNTASSVTQIGGPTNGSCIRIHSNKQVAKSILDSASAPTDGGAVPGSEASGTLPRGMYTIQKNGNAVTLYFNNSGTIQSLSLGTLA